MGESEPGEIPTSSGSSLLFWRRATCHYLNFACQSSAGGTGWMLACVSAAALSAFAPQLSTPPTRQSCHRLHAARMDDSYDEMVQHEYLQNSNAPRPAAPRQILNAPRTLNAAELHRELHYPSKTVAPDMQSAAFERGLQLGFSLAQVRPHPTAHPRTEPAVRAGAPSSAL